MIQLFRVIVDASNVVDENEKGYGFVDDFGYVKPFEGYFASVPSHNLYFAIQIEGAGTFHEMSFTSIPVGNPVPVRLPVLKEGVLPSLGFQSVFLGSLSNPNFGQTKSKLTMLDPILPFGPFRSMVKPGFAGNGINPNIQIASSSPIDVEVRLRRWGTSTAIPNVTMVYRGTLLNVTRVHQPELVPGPSCKKDTLDNPLGAYVWRATIPNAHTTPIGQHDLVITAQENLVSLTKTARLKFEPYPDWFDGNNMIDRKVDWSPTVVSLHAKPVPASTNVKAEVEHAGKQNSQVGMGQQEITCRLYLANTSALKQSGSMNSVALNNDAKPLQYSGTGDCASNVLPAAATAVPLSEPESSVPGERWTEGGLITPATVQKTTLLDTGYIKIFAYGFGIPEVAWIGISVDFRIKASAAINTTLPSAVQTLFDGGVEVGATLSIDVLFGLASGSGTFLADIGVQLPVTFKLDGQKVEPGKCFHYGLKVRVRIKALWATVHDKTHPIFQGMSPSNCYQAWVTPVVAAQDDPDAPGVPNAGPVLATDGFGHTLALWSTEEDEVVYSRLENHDWSTPQSIALDARGGNPTLAFYAPGQAVAVWSRSSLSEAPAPGTPLAEILRYQHLVYALWNGSDWSTPQELTPRTTGDGMAALAGCMSTDPGCPAGGQVIAVWVHDPKGDFTQRRFNVNYATFSTGAWSGIQSVQADSNLSDTEPDAAYHNGVPVVMWVRDPDRNFETFNDRRLALRFLDGASQVQVLNHLPAGIMAPSLAVDGSGNLQVAYNVIAPDDLPLGNRRMLYRAHGSCNGGSSCNWTTSQIVDEQGRTIFAESPIVTVAPKAGGGEEVILTYRAMGLEPATVPLAPLFAEPEPPGIADRTGELAQLSLPLTLESVNASPSYLTQNGAVNWQPAAIYDPVLNGVLAVAVSDPSLAVAHREITRQSAAQLLNPVAPLIVAFVPPMPNFVLKHAAVATDSLQADGSLRIQVAVQNTGPRWTEDAGDRLSVEARWGSPAGPVAGQAEIAALATGETTRLTVDVAPPAQPNWAQPLYVTVNPGQPLAEWTATDNAKLLSYPGLPAPANLHGSAVPDHPTIRLIWETATDPRVVGYRVYRLGPGNQRTPVGSTFVDGWIDTNAKWNETVVYGVAAFGADLTESDVAITEVAASVPPELETPHPPTHLYLPVVTR